MRWWIAIGCVLAACNGSGAIEVVIEIDPALEVDRVQLYVGLGDPRNGLDDMGQPQRELLVHAHARYPDRPNGFYWKRDPNGASDVIDLDPGATEARFTFHEGTHDQLTMIVVGYKIDPLRSGIVAAGALVDAKLEAGEVRQYHVTLKPASDALLQPSTTQVMVARWGPRLEDEQCAYLGDPALAERGIYIVDHDDRDCDGFPDEDPLECRADVWNGHRRPKPSETRCLRADIIPTAGPDNMACVLGGPGCVDGQSPNTTTCEPSRVCAQATACIACAGQPDPIGCMAGMPATATATTRVECTFFTTPVSAGPLTLCGGDAKLVQRFPFLPGCDAEQPFQFWATAGDTWKPSVVTADALTFTAQMPTSQCDLTLTATSSLPQVNAGGLRSVLVFPLANQRYGAVPLAIVVKPSTNGCNENNEKNECHLAGDQTATPSLAACLQSDVVEPW